MTRYTDSRNWAAETLYIEEDDFEEKLLERASGFRDFGEALTAFLIQNGYTGAEGNTAAKVAFLRDRFREKEVLPPRDFARWFAPRARITREMAYRICFAFALTIDDTNDFFRRVQLEKGIDCHTVYEATCYFCLKNRLSYNDSQEIMRALPEIEKVKSLPDEVLFTGTIVDGIDRMTGKEEFLSFIRENAGHFGYNNATATKYIRELWENISCPGGIAEKEGEKIDSSYNSLWTEKENRADNFVTVRGEASTWTAFSQILGLRNDRENEIATKYNRSLSALLDKNALLPIRASYCFPSRQGIDGLMRGKLSDNEMLRKLLILLTFYTYWAKFRIKEKNADYVASKADSARCLDTINRRLLDAGYQEMYAGNPYDWIFLWTLNDDNPLDAFRQYMDEILTYGGENPGQE